MAKLQKMPSIAGGQARHVYDALVLGGQLGGALAAAVLAKRGYRVLLVEHDGMGPGYEHDGFLLPYAPFVAPGLKAMPAVEEAFTELALTTPLQRALKPLTPALQLVLPRHRIDLHADPARTLAELRRELGDEGPQVATTLSGLGAYHEQSDAFFKEPVELPPDGFLQKWKLGGIIKRYPGLSAPLPQLGSERLGPLIQKLLPFLTYQSAAQTELARGRPLAHALTSPGRFPGGREGLRELLLKRLTELGGVVMGRDGGDGFVAESLAFEGNTLVGVKLLQSDNVYRASCVVTATDAGAMRRLIEDKKRHRKLLEQLDQSTTRQFLFTVNWVVPTDALPRGMGEQLLVQLDDELGAMLVQVHPARRTAKGEDESLRVVCAGAFVPSNVRELGEAHLKTLSEKLNGHLDALMPFARQQAVLTSAPYLDAGGVRGSRLLPHPLFDVDAEQRLGVEGLKQRTAIKNLFLANREVLPGLGLEGEFLAGLRVARLVQEALPKSNPLGR